MWKGGGTAAPQQNEQDEALHEALSQLDSLLRSARKNYKQILKVADQVLLLSPRDPDGLRCKVVALINIPNVSEALSVIENAAAAEVDLRFEKAYCLYRLGRFSEVLGLLQGLERSPGVLQLKAQTLYKAGDFASSIDAYEALHQEFGIDSSEVKSNAVAAYVSGGRSKEASQRMVAMQVNPKTLFELAYNTACVLIDKGEFQQAEEHLLLARTLGQEMLLEEECTEDEIEDELAPITAQLAYVEQVQGRSNEALEKCLAILKRDLKDKDLPTVAVVSNNLATIRKNKDASDSLRKLEGLMTKESDGKRLQFVDALQQKISVAQKESIVFNYFLLLLSTNKLNQAREVIPAIIEEYGSSSMPFLLQACLYLKEGKLDQAEEVLGKFSKENSESATEALLLCAQARASAGRHSEAAEVLQQIVHLKYMPALIATMVDLRERGGDVKGAENVLDEAVEWWSNSMEERPDVVELLIHKAANLKLKNKNFKAAAELFEKLAKSSSSEAVRLEAIAGLVRCCAETETDVSKAELFEKQLPGLKVVDAEALEKSSPPAHTISSKAKRAGEEKAGTQMQQQQEKKKRKRKPRYPKGFDPENPGPPPDPERWLPMRERSYYRPKKKDKRAQMRGSQGAISKDSGAAANANGPSGSKQTAPASASASATTTSTESKPSAGSSNKKKKGRR